MSLNNDYMVQILAHERHAQLLAEAASARLARSARGERDPWWRHPLATVVDHARHLAHRGGETAGSTVIHAAH